MKKRLLAAVLSFAMAFTMMPSTAMTVFAAENEAESDTSDVDSEEQNIVLMDETEMATEETSYVDSEDETEAATEAETQEETQKETEVEAADQSAEKTESDVSDVKAEEQDIVLMIDDSWTATAKEMSGDFQEDISIAENDSAYYKIVPEVDGTYVFGTTGSYDTYGVLYAADLTELTVNDDSGDVSNFLMIENLTAGVTYYLEVRGYKYAAINPTVYMYRKTLTVAEGSEQILDVNYSEDTTLSVTARAEDKEITYQWYCDGTLIEDAIGASYTVAAESYYSGVCYYRCVVTAGNESESVDFSLNVAGVLTVKYDGYLYPDYAEACTMEVYASAGDEEIHYQWQKYNRDVYEYEDIDNSDSESYTISARDYETDYERYRCVVTAGNQEENCYFQVEAVTLKLQVVSEDDTVSVGDEVTLEALASSSYSDNITYTWGCYDSTVEMSEDIHSSTYTFTVTADNAAKYYVIASDGFTIHNCDAYISYTGFSDVSLVNGEMEDVSGDEIGEELTFEPSFEAQTVDGSEAENITYNYTWYKYTTDEETGVDGWELIPDETDSTLTITLGPWDGDAEYGCKVGGTDSQGNVLETIMLTAYAYNDSGEYFSIAYTDWSGDDLWGSVRTFAVTELNGCELSEATYQWYEPSGYDSNGDPTGWKKIEGATSDSYSITESKDSPTSLKVVAYYEGASDYHEFRNETTSVSIDYDESVRTINVRYGKTDTFKVVAQTFDDSATLSYQWYKYNKSTDQSEKLAGETSDTYTPSVEDQTESEVAYFCQVSDGHSSDTIWCYESVYRTKVSVEYDSDDIYYGHDATFKANVTGDTTDITYKWYFDYEEVEGQTGSECVISADMLGEVRDEHYIRCCVTVGGTFTVDSYYYSFEVGSSIEINADDWVEVGYGKPVQLQVSASTKHADQELSYKWYKVVSGEVVLIEDATSNILEVSAEETVAPELYYYCRVSNDVETVTKMITVEVDRFGLENVRSIENYGNDIVLKAEPEGDTSDITYQWRYYDEDEDEYIDIDGATSSEYVISADEAKSASYFVYYCVLTSGEFKETLEYDVATKSTLAAMGAGDGYLYGEESIDLSLAAATSTDNDITYQWKKGTLGENIWTFEDIEGANNSSYSIDPKTLTSEEYRYVCLVSDGETSLEVVFNGEYSPFGEYDSDEQDLSMTLDENRELSVTDITSAISDDTLEYQWKMLNSDDEYEDIDGANEATLMLNNNTGYFYGGANQVYVFECVITDGIFSISREYYVRVTQEGESSLTVDYDRYPDVTIGDIAEMTVNATTQDPSKLTYTWYAYDQDFGFYEKLDENSNTLKVDTAELDVNQAYYYRYKCIVSDGTNSEDCYFYLDVNSPLVIYVSHYPYNVVAGIPVTLHAYNIYSSGSEAVEYQWYQGQGDERVLIKGATDWSYTVPADTTVEGYNYYQCKVTQGDYSEYYTVKVYCEGTEILELDKEYKVNSWDEDIFYTFTVPEDGVYTFAFTDDSDGSCEVYRANVDGTYETLGYITGEGYADPVMVSKMTKGETYYFLVYSGTFTLTKGGTTENYENITNVLTVGYDDEVTLDVSDCNMAEGNTYQWYFESYKLSGETDSSLKTSLPDVGTISSGGYVTYRCVITSADGRKYCETYDVDYSTIKLADNNPYEWQVDGNLDFYTDITAAPGQTLTLSVYGTSYLTDDVKYIWYAPDDFGDFEWIRGAEGPEYTITIPEDQTESMSYECRMSDGRSYIFCGFYIDIEDAAASISDAEVTLPQTSYTYTGSAQTPEPVVKLAGKTLVKGTDYTVAYSNNTAVGTAKVTVTGIGNYKDTVSKTFTIAKASISKATVTLPATTYTCTGSPLTPEPTVTLNGKTLVKDTDYTVAYANNTAYGTATVTVTGTGNYKDTASTTFKITCANPVITKVANASTGVTVAWNAVPGATLYRVYYKAASGTPTGWTKVADTTSLSCTKTGLTSGVTYYFTVKCITSTGAAMSDFDHTGKSIRYLSCIKPSVANASTGMYLTWSKVTGATGYIVYRKTYTSSTKTWSGWSQLSKITSNATVKYTDTAVKAKNGILYKYAVKAYYGSTSGAFTEVNVVRLTGISLTSATNTATRKMVLKWGRNTAATGYLIQYSTSSTFASGNKSLNIKSNATLTTTLLSLTKNKTYYVRIRAYRTIGSVNYYSAWSAVKSCKITK